MNNMEPQGHVHDSKECCGKGRNKKRVFVHEPLSKSALQNDELCTTVDLASLKFLQRSNWPGDIWINVDMGHHVQSPGTKNCAQ